MVGKKGRKWKEDGEKGAKGTGESGGRVEIGNRNEKEEREETWGGGSRRRGKLKETRDKLKDKSHPPKGKGRKNALFAYTRAQ
jgi:hypothetical protein